MKRKPIIPDLNHFPSLFRPLLEGAAVFDSSCGPDARVWFIDRDGGLFLKSAAKGALQTEAEMTRFYHRKGLSAEVLAYESLENDWLLTVRIPGEDCLHQAFLDDPTRLCDTTAEILRMLHSTDGSGCPVTDLTARRLAAARRNYGRDEVQEGDDWGFTSVEQARQVLEANWQHLRCDTLIHGDYCLPNILLNNWRFSGFIDLAAGGLGDRHMDLFWILWSLSYNLKTDRYRERFLDAYGRTDVEEEHLRTVAALEFFRA